MIQNAKYIGLPQSIQNSPSIPFREDATTCLHGKKDTYRIKSLCKSEGTLMIYSVENGQGNTLQAQKFEQRNLPKPLYYSRRRRLSRMKKAEMVLDVIQMDGAKYFITPMPSTPPLVDIESEDEAEMQLELSTETFPPLGSSDRKQYDGLTQGERSGNMHLSFADAIRNTGVPDEPANPLTRRLIL